MMTYKQAIDNFRSRYRLACLQRHTITSGKTSKAIQSTELVLTNNEILMLLSKPYADLCNKYRLIEKRDNLDLIALQYEYNINSLGATAVNAIQGCPVDIKQVTLNDGVFTPLKRLSPEMMAGIYQSCAPVPISPRPTGLPAYWAIDLTNDNKILILNTTPNLSYAQNSAYRLIIHYWQKIFEFTGTAELSFADLDYTAAGYGGSFLNPTEWNSTIILGALSELLDYKTAEYQSAIQRNLESKPVNSGGLPIYYLGI